MPEMGTKQHYPGINLSPTSVFATTSHWSMNAEKTPDRESRETCDSGCSCHTNSDTPKSRTSYRNSASPESCTSSKSSSTSPPIIRNYPYGQTDLDFMLHRNRMAYGNCKTDMFPYVSLMNKPSLLEFRDKIDELNYAAFFNRGTSYNVHPYGNPSQVTTPDIKIPYHGISPKFAEPPFKMMNVASLADPVEAASPAETAGPASTIGSNTVRSPRRGTSIKRSATDSQARNVKQPRIQKSAAKGKKTTKGTPTRWNCKVCNHGFETKQENRNHYLSHVPDHKKLYCFLCDFITEHKHHMEYHVSIHKDMKPFLCKYCDYTCINKSMITSHLKSHSELYPYTCNDCEFVAKHCHTMKLHLRKNEHQPGVIFNTDGKPNTEKVMDVHGKKRGPRASKQNNDDSEDNTGDYECIKGNINYTLYYYDHQTLLDAEKQAAHYNEQIMLNGNVGASVFTTEMVIKQIMLQRELDPISDDAKADDAKADDAIATEEAKCLKNAMDAIKSETMQRICSANSNIQSPVAIPAVEPATVALPVKESLEDQPLNLTVNRTNTEHLIDEHVNTKRFFEQLLNGAVATTQLAIAHDAKIAESSASKKEAPKGRRSSRKGKAVRLDRQVNIEEEDPNFWLN